MSVSLAQNPDEFKSGVRKARAGAYKSWEAEQAERIVAQCPLGHEFTLKPEGARTFDVRETVHADW